MDSVALKIVFLLACCLHIVRCQERAAKDTSNEPPWPSSSRPPEAKHRLQRVILSIFFGMITGLIFALLFAWLVRCFVRYINRTPILKGPVVFTPKIPSKTLQSALANETELLGSSPSGKYYKTVLDNGLTIAVKRLEPFETHSKSVKRRIQQELEFLASLRHRNLMSLRAYIRESARFYLVYDYMPNGSLEDAMNRVRQNQLQLNWDVRLRIAVGIVKGLQYLHFTCTPRILHYNLKPTNVMLDAEFEPRLADCGLVKLNPNFDRAAASAAYSSPESFQNCRYTDKSDVFSFGVILGMLLTGRNPTDPSLFGGETSSGGGGSLGQWLRHVQQAGDERQALDRSIIINSGGGGGVEEEEEDEMLMAVRIALVCLSDLPADRPSSDELVSMLTQLNSF